MTTFSSLLVRVGGAIGSSEGDSPSLQQQFSQHSPSPSSAQQQTGDISPSDILDVQVAPTVAAHPQATRRLAAETLSMSAATVNQRMYLSARFIVLPKYGLTTAKT